MNLRETKTERDNFKRDLLVPDPIMAQEDNAEQKTNLLNQTLAKRKVILCSI
jgi:hypothetical protein